MNSKFVSQFSNSQFVQEQEEEYQNDGQFKRNFINNNQKKKSKLLNTATTTTIVSPYRNDFNYRIKNGQTHFLSNGCNSYEQETQRQRQRQRSECDNDFRLNQFSLKDQVSCLQTQKQKQKQMQRQRQRQRQRQMQRQMIKKLMSQQQQLQKALTLNQQQQQMQIQQICKQYQQIVVNDKENSKKYKNEQDKHQKQYNLTNQTNKLKNDRDFNSKTTKINSIIMKLEQQKQEQQQQQQQQENKYCQQQKRLKLLQQYRQRYRIRQSLPEKTNHQQKHNQNNQNNKNNRSNAILSPQFVPKQKQKKHTKQGQKHEHNFSNYYKDQFTEMLSQIIKEFLKQDLISYLTMIKKTVQCLSITKNQNQKLRQKLKQIQRSQNSMEFIIKYQNMIIQQAIQQERAMVKAMIELQQQRQIIRKEYENCFNRKQKSHQQLVNICCSNGRVNLQQQTQTHNYNQSQGQIKDQSFSIKQLKYFKQLKELNSKKMNIESKVFEISFKQLSSSLQESAIANKNNIKNQQNKQNIKELKPLALTQKTIKNNLQFYHSQKNQNLSHQSYQTFKKLSKLRISQQDIRIKQLQTQSKNWSIKFEQLKCQNKELKEILDQFVSFYKSNKK